MSEYDLTKRGVGSYVITIFTVITYVMGVLVMYFRYFYGTAEITTIDHVCQIGLLILLFGILKKNIIANILYVILTIFYTGIASDFMDMLDYGMGLDFAFISKGIYVLIGIISLIDLIIYNGYKRKNPVKDADWYYGKK